MIQKTALYYIICIFAFVTSCGHKNEPVFKTDIVGLARVIQLDSVYRPEKVHWIHKAMGMADSRAPGPTDAYLVAILDYDSASGRLYFNVLKNEPEIDKSNLPYYKDQQAEAGLPGSVSRCFKDKFQHVKIYDASRFARYAGKGWFFLTDDWKVFIYVQAT